MLFTLRMPYVLRSARIEITITVSGALRIVVVVVVVAAVVVFVVAQFIGYFYAHLGTH